MFEHKQLGIHRHRWQSFICHCESEPSKGRQSWTSFVYQCSCEANNDKAFVYRSLHEASQDLKSLYDTIKIIWLKRESKASVNHFPILFICHQQNSELSRKSKLWKNIKPIIIAAWNNGESLILNWCSTKSIKISNLKMGWLLMISTRTVTWNIVSCRPSGSMVQ